MPELLPLRSLPGFSTVSLKGSLSALGWGPCANDCAPVLSTHWSEDTRTSQARPGLAHVLSHIGGTQASRTSKDKRDGAKTEALHTPPPQKPRPFLLS